jgi:hypothetical protein
MNKSTLLSVLRLTFGMSKMPSAQDIPPNIFIGTVTVDGEPALPGTGITAIIEGKEKGFAQVHELGVYGPLYVKDPPSDRQITFRVDNQMADQTVPGNQGGATILDLTADTNAH